MLSHYPINYISKKTNDSADLELMGLEAFTW